jgi:hypothetical protein
MSGDAVATVVDFLAPFVPYLLRATEEAADEAARRFGSDAWARAKRLWQRIRGVDHPKDDDWQAAVKTAMANPATAQEVLALTQTVQSQTNIERINSVENFVIGSQFNYPRD